MSDIITVTPQALMPVMNVEQAVERHKQMTVFVRHLMKEDRDYGTIPGTKGRSLWKAGAEKLTTFFGLTIRFVLQEKIEDWDGADYGGEPFFYYRWNCLLSSGDRLIAEAEGSANSREAKWRYRQAKRSCPTCGEDVRKSKQGERGWYCWVKTGGCGATFATGDPAIESQQLGRILNPDIADQVNTILKIAQKRALVAATLLAVNASEFFDDETVAPEPPATATEEELGHLDERSRNEVKRDQARPANSRRREEANANAKAKPANGNDSPQRSAINWDAFIPVLASMYKRTEDTIRKQLGDLSQYASSADAKAAIDGFGDDDPQGTAPGDGGWDTWSVTERNGFWAKAGALGLPNDSLHKEMGVKSMKAYSEPLETARAILDILDYGINKCAVGLQGIWTALHVDAVCEFNMTVEDAKEAIDAWALAQDESETTGYAHGKGTDA